MIRSVRFENFKSLRDVQTTLEPLTVLVGPNSSGKTNFLQAIHAFHEAASLLKYGGLEASKAAAGYLAMHRVKTNPSPPMSLEIWPDDIGKHYIIARPQHGGDWSAIQLFCRPPYDGCQLTPSLEFETGPAHSVLLRLELSKLAKPSVMVGASPRLSPNGDWLANVLANLATKVPDSLRALQESLQSVVTDVRSIKLRPVSIISPDILTYHVMLDTVGASDVELVDAGEGTILTLGILAALENVELPLLLLVDDIGRGLHPKALESFIKLLRKLIATKPGLQIVATTHSPYLLDHLSIEEVRVVVFDQERGSVIGRLSDHPDAERCKSVLRTGEFWSSVGEEWLINGVK